MHFTNTCNAGRWYPHGIVFPIKIKDINTLPNTSVKYKLLFVWLFLCLGAMTTKQLIQHATE